MTLGRLGTVLALRRKGRRNGSLISDYLGGGKLTMVRIRGGGGGEVGDPQKCNVFLFRAGGGESP